MEEDQPNDPNKENSVSPASALETFLKTYHTFISENQSVCIDLDRIVQDLNAQVSLLPPPKEYSLCDVDALQGTNSCGGKANPSIANH